MNFLITLVSLFSLHFFESAYAENADSTTNQEMEVEFTRERRIPCDPAPPIAEFVPVPKNQDIVCGDGRLSDYSSSCSKTCGDLGCGKFVDCNQAETVCTKAREVCDGKNLGRLSCKKLGFFGGSMNCDSTCKSFDVSSCQICRSDSRTKCHTLKLPHEHLDFSLSSPYSLQVIPTEVGISLAWEYLDGSGANTGMAVALATVQKDGKILLTDKKRMTKWIGARRPKLIANSKRLILVAQNDLKVFIQEFDLLGSPSGEVFSIPGGQLSSVALEGDYLKVQTWTPNAGALQLQLVDLKLKRVVNPEQPHQNANTQNETVLRRSPQRQRSALATNSLLTNRFKVDSGNFEFEGAFLVPENTRSSPTIKDSKTYPVRVQNGMLVVSIRKTRN